MYPFMTNALWPFGFSQLMSILLSVLPVSLSPAGGGGDPEIVGYKNFLIYMHY
jgi:hypothetical protein